MIATISEADIGQFRALKGQINDLYEFSGETIRAKKIVTASATFFTKMAWLVDNIEKFADVKLMENRDRFLKVKAALRKVLVDHDGAIKTGQFVKINAGIFSAARFLVRELEKAIVSIVDPEIGVRLKSERLADENVSAIQLVEVDGVGGPDDDVDDDDDDDATDTERR